MAIEKAFWFENEQCYAIAFFELDFLVTFWAMQKSNCLHKAKANPRYTTFGQNLLKGLHLICLL
ncbi:MAG: hypothetical protein IPN86_10170 [Saprospiraceae bacterium]|nr:hypothetical protein [Saprospiraceae bacterium]